MNTSSETPTIEQWDFFELTLDGQPYQNTYQDARISAFFEHADGSSILVNGFYDGDGAYRIRFMPTLQGEWTYETRSNVPSLERQKGRLLAIAPTGNNHGPVVRHGTFHFRYADGTPYRPIGTTVYALSHQGEALESVTMKTLANSPFNKVRLCVFPKNYAFNNVEPPLYPYLGTPPTSWRFFEFNPAFFAHFEKRIGQLRDLGIEADVILFHPYDDGRWGFDRMLRSAENLYLHYVVTRLAAFRNVWWSIANEWDFMKMKTAEDFHHYIRRTKSADPYGHLLSIHNGYKIYNQMDEDLTHCSIQNGSAVEDFGRAQLYRDCFYKPIMFDEVKYEGDIPQRWGNLSAEEMVHRFWQGTIAGCYVTHGETYKHPEAVIWWARGGELHGQSPARIQFLKDVLATSPADGIDPIDKWQDHRTAGKAGEYYLIYFGHEAPSEWSFSLPRAGLVAGMKFRLELLDTWNMTIEPVPGEFTIIVDDPYRYHAEGLPTIKLPGRKFMALRLTRVGGEVLVDEKKVRVYGEEQNG